VKTILIAPNSFKESASSVEVASYFQQKIPPSKRHPMAVLIKTSIPPISILFNLSISLRIYGNQKIILKKELNLHVVKYDRLYHYK
jgi:hypothetical protein